jgi:hypothetical protein
MGTDMLRRCTSCLKCRECKFRVDSLSFKENQEYQVILDSLKFDEVKGKWMATYPFRIPPSTLKDNFEQVYRYTLPQERRLEKQERTEEFNSEFNKTMKRGVFREIGPNETPTWGGPVNYISMAEAF